MPHIERVYESLLNEHYKKYTQMLFLAGPRQVGKTTLGREAKQLGYPFYYLSWDTKEDRGLILEGATAVGKKFTLGTKIGSKAVIVFDEIHKNPDWKNFLKGFFDLYKNHAIIIVTGSSRLDVFRRGGDSLMGRYFLYHIHPFSVAELTHQASPLQEIQKPHKISDKTWEDLFHFGGFPEPFLQGKVRTSP